MEYPAPSATLRELSEPEYFSLLDSVTHGRLAITQKALPAIVPIRLWLLDDEVIVSPLLGRAVPLIPDSVVALQAGPLGQGLASDWSVEVRGFLREWSDTTATAQADGNRSSTERFRMTSDHVRGWSVS
jgi:hypothetical protein